MGQGLTGNGPIPCQVVAFDSEICRGCNVCVEVCRADVLIPNRQKGKPPILLYPDECWFCGCCVGHCPHPGAIAMNHPLCQRAAWKRKTTGRLYRIGMNDAPPPHVRPPVGGW